MSTHQATSGQTRSYWMHFSPKTNFLTLKKKVHVDVAIIGGGIAGLTAATHLKLAGKTVAVLDQGEVLAGETGRTTAHITELIDTRYHTLESDFGKSGARLIALACRSANDQIADWVKRWNIDCDFQRVPGFLYTISPDHVKDLKKELKACQKVGLNVQWINDVPLPFKTYGGIRIEDQAQFHPRKYLLALANKIPGDHSYIFENTQVTKITEGDPCRVITEGGEITAQDIIIATNTYSFNKVFLATKVAAYRSYAISSRLKKPPLIQGLYWDTADPYHYIRAHDDVWIIGGEDHKTGMNEQTNENFENLIQYSQSHFEAGPVLDQWSGQIMEPVDGIPYIGLNSGCKHTYVSTGFTGNGMTFGTLSGMIIPDLILKKKNLLAGLFNPTRIKPIASAYEFVSENKDFPLCLIEDYVLRKNVVSPEAVASLPAGEGCVVTQNGSPVAIYRDQKDSLHCVSAICPHMGCQVHWNHGETSWDCPCHGSRFTPDGELLNGPATTGLKPASFFEPKESSLEKSEWKPDSDQSRKKHQEA